MFATSKTLRLTAAAAAVIATFSVHAPKAHAISLAFSAYDFGQVFANFSGVGVAVLTTFDDEYALKSIQVVSGSPPFDALPTGDLCIIDNGGQCTFSAYFEPLSTGFFTGRIEVTECRILASTDCHIAGLDLKGEGIPRAVVTPIPSTLALFATGLGLIGYTVRRRRLAVAAHVY